MPTPYTGGVNVSFQLAAGGQLVSFGEITRITANRASSANRPRISIAHLGSQMTMQQGSAVVRVEEPYTHVWQNSGGSGQSLDVDYIGTTTIDGGVSGTLTVNGPFSINVTNATVSNSVVTGAVGDLVRRTIQVVW